MDSLAALKNEKVGVVNSSTGDIVVSEVLGKNSTAIKRFDNTPLMLQELFEDGVSAAVGDVGVVKYYYAGFTDLPVTYSDIYQLEGVNQFYITNLLCSLHTGRWHTLYHHAA